MRQLTRNRRRGEGPPTRFPDEQMDVEVPVYLVAVSLGEDDHDLHVIVSDSARGRNRDFMNVEVSGLPRNRVDEGLFARARTQISGILSSVDMTRMGSYLRIDPPLPVLVQGSLFFDVTTRPDAVTARARIERNLRAFGRYTPSTASRRSDL